MSFFENFFNLGIAWSLGKVSTYDQRKNFISYFLNYMVCVSLKEVK